MPTHTDISAIVGQCNGRIVIKLAGACTATLCERVESFLHELSKPKTSDVYFDLSEADWLDSTFAGFLVAMAIHMAGPSTPDIHLMDLSGGAAQSLANIHVLRLFDILDEAPIVPDEWHELPAQALDVKRIGQLVVESHEALIQADKRNAPAFEHLIELFKANLNHNNDPDSTE